MIGRDEAVAMVERLVQEDSARQERPADDPYVVTVVREHRFGWFVYWNSAKFVRTRDLRDSLVGGGPYLVDRFDGSIHGFGSGDWTGWEKLYEQRGLPDTPAIPFRDEIMAAEREIDAARILRRHVPAFTVLTARDYVRAVRGGAAPPQHLMEAADPGRREPWIPFGLVRPAIH